MAQLTFEAYKILVRNTTGGMQAWVIDTAKRDENLTAPQIDRLQEMAGEKVKM